MEIIYRGAEAILYLDFIEGEKVLVKERIEKKYRIKEIDEKLRKSRTRKEVNLLREARSVGIATPQVFLVDEKNHKIVMEFIEGIRLKEFLNQAKKEEIEKVCFELGREIGKLHSSGIAHGDLTTSNIILKENKLYFIDFSLGEFSRRIEDFGIDLNLLYEALKAAHFKILKLCWDNIVKGYKKEYKNAEEVLRKVEEIEKRARYMERKNKREK
ncbi:MAG: KEOPS complex kinase/ATPase Bud32 [Candidatus Aenigmarchaeota archaeon]|nr:KEOPS complex kinase/ATPase Bud32 [Candidatus Aenigmarchaeota archaeon]